MSNSIVLRPNAAALAASMRDIGYSLETAVADLVDNSITAQASEVRIRTSWTTGEPCLAVLDDGAGMDYPTLVEAMRHGTSGPSRTREPGDLGRFGLGLKTASLSQCRSLTVVSRQKGITFAARWDLDVIQDSGDWTLGLLSDEEVERLPFINELPATGTMVLWQKLDRLSVQAPSSAVIAEHLEAVEHHLALVFHLFLDVRKGPKLKISINNSPVEAFDPFFTSNRATQRLPVETVTIQESLVKLTPMILPHHSKLSKTDQSHYGNRSEFVSAQGAYVYRNRRLVAWGDWFRVIPKTEATKLARVMVEFDSSQDELWSIDIKKSRASAPAAVREKLRQIIPSIRSSSGRVYQGYAQRSMQARSEPVWERIVSDSGTRYQINRHHVVFAHLAEKLGNAEAALLNALLSSIERALPVEMIYADYSFSDPAPREHEEDEDAMKNDLLVVKEELLAEVSWSSDLLHTTVEAIWPDRFPPALLERLIAELEAA